MAAFAKQALEAAMHALPVFWAIRNIEKLYTQKLCNTGNKNVWTCCTY